MKILFLLLIVISCSSWDREKCLTTDWYQKGVEDASSYGEGEFPRYKSACAEEGISVAGHASSYQKGLSEGMRSWCSYQNGYKQGVEGKSDRGQCDLINPAFARGMEEGHREFKYNEREKKYKQDVEEFKRKVLRNSDTKECYVDSDCRKSGECSLGRCRHHTSRACIYATDCEVRGRCELVTETSSYGPPIQIKVCDYGRW